MIKFIYFDVGGVVVDDFSGNNGWNQLKTELGVTPEVDEAFMKTWYPYEHEVLVGRDIETLLPILCKKFNLEVDEGYSLLDGFVSRFHKNGLIWPIIEKAKLTNPVGLLTNMYPGMLAAIRDRGMLPPVAWDAVVDSSIEVLKKPDLEIFERAEQLAHAAGQEILFIDNTVGHITAAKVYGWQTYYYDSSNHEESCKQLEHFLSEKGLIS